MQDYDDEFPAPPTAEEFSAAMPAPPPRDSSKEVMMEYTAGKCNSGPKSKH